ncbi:uncharacterized protein N7469_001936 [Penicillium citrinum]|uniref:Uncharacterized protein n=1 Tax=Penicillium citrinum TaxID=5077 RepID=A0A9W9P9Q8_PENCI|nr:uncharacterized protein N7469_001936 [Penicillium citrinum]KAJ5240345.1 hypothetical protein N7469_001936 [Penicillium citrinum]
MARRLQQRMHVWSPRVAPMPVGKPGHLRMEDQEEVDNSDGADHPAVFILPEGRKGLLCRSALGLLMTAGEKGCPQLRQSALSRTGRKG